MRPRFHSGATPCAHQRRGVAQGGGVDVSGVRSVASVGRALPDPPNPELSGWPVDPRERCDFYHRIRVFPPDVADWRKHTVARLLKERTRFRGVSASESIESVRAKLDDGISHLKEVARLASLLYDSTTQSTTGPKATIGPEADRVLCRLGIYRELGLSVE